LFAVFELAMHIGQKGAQKLEPMNTGGTVKSADFDLSLTPALHSSSSDGVYLGNPCGIVIRSNEGRTLHHMGDTEVFDGMALINELHQPDIGIVPIGDRFTMGARAAALACKKFFKFKTIIPCHYGTFPIIEPSADKFLVQMKGQPVVAPKIGVPIDV
jgi:L-ascorbate metabolism protein UlaG (beta-lactamase superfamily)